MIVVADIGGTHLRMATADEQGHFGHLIVADTPQSYEKALGVLTTYKSLLGTESLKAVSVGVAGLIAPDQPLLTAHLLDWNGKPLKEDLERIFGVPAYLENDTIMGALGEATLGAGKGAHVVGYIAVGTGIGGRRVVDSAIDDPIKDEIGHRIISIDGVEKEFEEFVSGATISKEHGMPPSDLHDPVAWETYSRYFAYGIKDVLLSWKPDRVVLGGFIPNDERISIALVKKYLESEVLPSTPLPEFVYAALPYSGLTGANLFARQKSA